MTSSLRREFLKGLLVALPLALAQSFLLARLESFSEQPWLVAALLLPLAVALVLLGRPLYRERRLVLGGGFLAFFFVFCLAFSLAAGTDLLEGRRTPLRGYDDAVPGNFLGLARLGDWHYWVAPRARPALDLAIVTFPSFGGVETWKARRTHAGLVNRAVRAGAKGVAFDYYFPRQEEDNELARAMTRAFCSAIGDAVQAGVPVVLGYAVDEIAGRLAPRPLPEELQECDPAPELGSLAGYRESDGRVRMVPLFRAGDRDVPSFSYQVAEQLAGGEPPPAPAGNLLQFLRPAEEILRLDGEINPQAGDLASLQPAAGGQPLTLEQAERLLADRFVLVGSRRPGDQHQTPWGLQPGVVIHAWAAHGLRSGEYIRRPDRLWSFPSVFALCYLLTAVQASGRGRRGLLLGAVVLSVVVVASAAAAMRFGLVWIDVSYALLAIWLLTALLLGGARLQKARLQAAPARSAASAASAEPADEPFDVFLSHNSRDKPVVRELGEALRERGLRVWLDEWELVPGRPWQEALEEVIETVKSAAVLVGRDGLGPWEVPEMRACLDEAVRRGLPVIPVLLPGAGESPELPLFLRGFTWVDLRSGLTPKGLDRLEWGVTGIKPRSRGRAA